jgi:hypothetical protein
VSSWDLSVLYLPPRDRPGNSPPGMTEGPRASTRRPNSQIDG